MSLLAIGGPVRAADTADPCSSQAPTGDTQAFDGLHEAFDRAVRPDPEAALPMACSEARGARTGAQQLRSRVDLGHALVSASRDREALGVLDDAITSLANEAPGFSLLLRGEALLWRGNAYEAMREMQKAGSDYLAAQSALLEAGVGGTSLYIQVLVGLSTVRERALDLDGAEQAVVEAEALLTRLGLQRSRDASDVWNKRTMIAYGRQDYPGTIRDAEMSLKILREVDGPDGRDALEPLATLIAMRSITADFAGTERDAREALRIAALHPSTTMDARLGIIQNFSSYYMDRGEPTEALPLAREALALSIDHFGEGSPAVLRAYLTLGATHQVLAQYHDARVDFEAAAKIAAVHEQSIGVLQKLRLHFLRASLELMLGNLDTASDELAIAGALMRNQPRLDYWRGWGARLSCRVHAVRSQWLEADAACADAVIENTTVFNATHHLVLSAWVGRCIAQSSGGLPGDACARVDQLLRTSGYVSPGIRVFALEALATDRSLHGKGDAALALRVQAMAAAEEYALADPLWATQFALAQSVLKHGDRPLAIFLAKRSTVAIEEMRGALSADRERLERGFLSDKLTVYRHLADWLLEEQRTSEAIAVLRLLKREEQYDYVERGVVEPSERLPYTPDENGLARLFDAAPQPGTADLPAKADASELARLVRLRDGGRPTSDETATLLKLLADARRREALRVAKLHSLIAVRRESLPVRVDDPGPGNRALRMTGAIPVARTADAYYFVADARLNLIFAWSGGIESRVVDVDPKVLDRVIGDYLAAMPSREDVTRSDASSSLYRWLGKPLAEAADRHGVDRIRLSLDGALRYVPFASLWDGQRYLIERYEFSYPFAQTDAVRGPAPAQDPHTLVAFGVTRAFAGMPALAGVGDELCGIVDGPVMGLDEDKAACAATGRGSGALPGSGFANAYFTEARLHDAMAFGESRTSTGRRPRPDLLHVGTHFQLRPGNMQRSWLLLGDGTHLPLSSLQQTGFEGMTLVTLSACQTGMAGSVTDDGREIESLPAILHRRGAKAVVASLWTVDDRGASLLMQHFYAELTRPGASIAGALRSAQLAMLRGPDASLTRPYYWAAFSVTGDDR